jgi:hypothetical protein
MHRLPTSRAILAAAIPGLIVFSTFYFWLGLAPAVAVGAGILWTAASLLVTRVLYDDAESEMAAWRDAAPDLADSVPLGDAPPPPAL